MAVTIDFAGQTVLVTGGTKGVGRGIAQRFVDAGADVVVCGRTPPGDEVPGEFVECDVRDAEQVAAMVDGVHGRSGRLDVVINNAGGSPAADAAEASPRFTQRVVELNLLAAIHVSQAANRVMQADAGGAIVNIASVSARRPSPGTAAYGAAKAGLISYTQSVAVEWAPKVRVNAIVAGMIETEQSELFYGDADGVARVAATVPLGRLAQPTEIGDACLFLASPLASYVTGSTLELHGGGEWPAFLRAARGD